MFIHDIFAEALSDMKENFNKKNQLSKERCSLGAADFKKGIVASFIYFTKLNQVRIQSTIET